MSAQSKFNRHLKGWRRGDPKPAPIIRQTLRAPKPVQPLRPLRSAFGRAEWGNHGGGPSAGLQRRS